MNSVINKYNLNKVKKLKKPLVFVPMAADILHHGHIKILLKASKYGSVIVGLMTDNGIKKYKKKLPIFKYRYRKEILDQIKLIKLIIPLDGLKYSQIMNELKCEFFVHGSDWKNNNQKTERKKLIKLVKEWNCKVIEPIYTKNISSSKIKNHLDI